VWNGIAAPGPDTLRSVLVFTHVIPPLPMAPMESLFLEGVTGVWNGPVVVGRDGMTFTLGVGEESIERGFL